MVKPSLPVHAETGNPIAFMKLPKDIRETFDQHVAETMAKNPEWSELEARLRLGQKARYSMNTDRWIELRWDHWLTPDGKGNQVPVFKFVVEVHGLGSHKIGQFDKVDDAFKCWDEYERQWAIEIASKALGLI